MAPIVSEGAWTAHARLPEGHEEPRDSSSSEVASSRVDAALDSFFRPGAHSPLPPIERLEPGRVIGEFRLVSMIGQGGMGQVWEARQTSLGERRVAVKFIRPERVSEKQLAYFEREARAGGRLSHPGIVSVIGHGTTDGLAWIAMELVEDGWTIRDYLDELPRGDALPRDYDRQVAQFIRDVSIAMQAAHDCGVIHRDLKPQNILVTLDNHPKVTDFGLARIVEESALSHSGDVAGTYYYMSPEQVAAKRTKVDHRTDIFSLGVVLYEMLTGQRPFKGDASHQIAYQIAFEEPLDPRAIRSRIPRELVAIVNKALEKEPHRRYATMAGLGDDLTRFLSDLPVLAKPPTAVQRVVKWVRRHPGPSLGGAVAALLFVIISSLFVQTTRWKRQVTRLLLSERYDDIVTSADQLWPALPEKIDAYLHWIDEGRELMDQVPDLEAVRDELRRGATLLVENGDREWSYPADDPESSWLDIQLSRLLEALESLVTPEVGLLAVDASSREHGWSIPKRLASAEDLRDGFDPGGEYGVRWGEALPEIRATYGGLDLSPQMGLVPIGRDPESKLWEFWHVQSGSKPLRDENGRLQLEEDSGLVFVLLPGGTFWMGAQTDPDGKNGDLAAFERESPVHEVTLSPFFLSKYEMTQGQWEQLTGFNPSYYQKPPLVEDARHPVENISWMACNELFSRFGLTLPSEAQWEYGARGGTGTPWWTGADRESLREKHAANLACQAALRMGARWSAIYDWPELDDGYGIHAPVGTFAANGFGLHEVHGNVWEWCLDGFDASYYQRSELHDPINAPESSDSRVIRGGKFSENAIVARSAHREGGGPTVADRALGVRPARKLD